MAVIDTFLKLLVAQKADSLIIVPEEVPAVVKADDRSELPMPAVPTDLAKRLAQEVVGTERSGELQEGKALEGTYRSDDGEEFSYRVESNGSGCRIQLHSLATDDHAEPPQEDPAKVRPEQSRGELTPVSPISSTKLGEPAVAPQAEILSVLDQALEVEASDLFLSAGKPVQMRVNGAIHALNTAPISDAMILQLLPGEEARHDLEHSGSADFAVRWGWAGKSCRFRINIFRHSNGHAAALRPVRPQIPSLDQLQLPPDLLELGSYSRGLVLVTGASGSGKSSTLAALVDHINQTMARHIITIEDPIEFEYQDAKSLVHQREVGADVESFSAGLRAALRENPDVILLGEMRDLPTISAALTAAETGHLVFSTLHTGSATAAVNRIVDVFTGQQQAHVRTQLAASLRAVVAQRLVPSADGTSRIPAIEKLLVTPAVANGIRDAQEHHMRSAIQTGGEEGMITLERYLASLAQRGKITRETAYQYAEDRRAVEKLLA